MVSESETKHRGTNMKLYHGTSKKAAKYIESNSPPEPQSGRKTRPMQYLSAWAAYTGSVTEWITSLLESGDITPADIIWIGDDGSYAVGEDWPTSDDFDNDTEMNDHGTVAEYLAD